MKIITGLSTVYNEADIKKYIDAGVDEFFIGYVPPEWSEVYGFEVSCNRREHANYNYQNINEIESVVNIVHKYGKKVFLALNAHEYTSDQIKLLTQILSKIKHVKFDAFIIGNLALMLELRDKGFELPFNISIGGGNNNADAIFFFVKAIPNIGRAVLSRKLTISEIENITQRLSGYNVPIEAFGLAEACFFNDEYCFTWHSGATKSFCQSPMYKNRQVSPITMGVNWKRELKPENFQNLFAKRNSIAAEVDELHQEYHKKHRIPQATNNDVNAIPHTAKINKCGLCAVQKFKDWGIDAVKLPLRGGSLQMNIPIIELVKKVVDRNPATPSFCQSLLNSTVFCSGKNCYYNFPFEK